jgi:hypothetical protein
MSKFVITTALALVLAGGAYAADHGGHGGSGGGGGIASGGGGGGGGGASTMSHGPSGPSNFGSVSHGPSGPSNFSSTSHGPSGPSNFAQGPQGRTLYNQSHGNRDIRGDEHRQYGRLDRDALQHGRTLYNRQGDFDRGKFDRDNRIGRDRDLDFRHRGIVRGDFFEHGRHFHFRRFFHGEWVFLSDWDDCAAWAWVHVGPGVWAWRPINICIG